MGDKGLEDFFACPHCGKTFVTERNLKSHQRYHTLENVDCPVCLMTFPNKFHLKMHSRIHDPKVYRATCKICNQNFNSASAFSSHRKLHLEAKQYTCEHCQKGFARKDYLT